MNYETAQDLFDALSAPFPSDYVEWRLGSTNPDKTKGRALAYIDARVVMDRLDTICGPDAWQCNYDTVNGSAVCNLGLKMPSGEWLWKADGAGQTDIEGEKGALSDALKRAAVRWGVGRYLYDIKSPQVAIEPYGKSYKIAEAEVKKLDDLHEDYAHKTGWGLRSGVQAYRLLKKITKEFVVDQASAQEFKKKNEAEIAQLPVAMRKHLFEQLDRVGASEATETEEAA